MGFQSKILCNMCLCVLVLCILLCYVYSNGNDFAYTAVFTVSFDAAAAATVQMMVVNATTAIILLSHTLSLSLSLAQYITIIISD